MGERENPNIIESLFEMHLYMKTHGFVLGLILYLKERGESEEHIEEVIYRLNRKDSE